MVGGWKELEGEGDRLFERDFAGAPCALTGANGLGYLLIALFGLFGTVALLLAKRWVAAGLALPTAMAIFIGLYLLVVLVMPRAPSLVFILLLLLLNGGVLWLAWRFLISTHKGNIEPERML